MIAFASRVAGTLILLWASMVSASNGFVLDFRSALPQAGLYLVVAAAFVWGSCLFTYHMRGESSIRRGFGTGLRMISAGSSLILLARIPLTSIESPITPYLIIFVSFAALYGAWMWMRSPDELTGRPFWLIGLGSLAVAAALRANSIGATAWSCALILAGAALFLSSANNQWVERALFIGVMGNFIPAVFAHCNWMGQWRESFWFAIPLLIVAHAMLMTGFIRHIQRPSARTNFDDQPIWAKNVYPIGIVILLLTILMLGFFGWKGILQFGNWIASLSASLLTLGLLWLTPRLRILNPVRAHWVRPSNPSWLDLVYQGLMEYISTTWSHSATHSQTFWRAKAA